MSEFVVLKSASAGKTEYLCGALQDAAQQESPFLRYQRENLAEIARVFSGATHSDVCVSLRLAASSATLARCAEDCGR